MDERIITDDGQRDLLFLGVLFGEGQSDCEIQKGSSAVGDGAFADAAIGTHTLDHKLVVVITCLDNRSPVGYDSGDQSARLGHHWILIVALMFVNRRSQQLVRPRKCQMANRRLMVSIFETAFDEHQSR